MTENTFWRDLTSGKFAQMVRDEARGEQLNNSREVYNVMKSLFAENDDVETFFCLFLDGRNRIISIEKMFSGSISSAAIYPREIVKRVNCPESLRCSHGTQPPVRLHRSLK